MIIATIAGNVGKNPEMRQAGEQDVCGFSVATRHPKKEETIWVDVSIWGKRGEALSKIIRKGDKITVIGTLSTREHDGKTYLKIDALDVEPQGDKPSNDRDDDRKDDRKDDRRTEARREEPRRDERRDDRRSRDDDRKPAPKEDSRYKREDDLPY